jgi:predicted nuclease of restriction endonuclease-like (RecB) superfamily
MNKNIIKQNEYKEFFVEIKQQIQNAQIKAALSVNKELLRLYWNIASMMIEKQKNYNWGDGFIEQIAKDLQNEFPNLKGFSVRNIKYIRQWYLYWTEELIIGQQLVAQLDLEKIFQIPWGHNILIISKIKDIKKAIFYIHKTIENNWSRNVLIHQIESNLFQRQGGAITNFKEKLPDAHSDLALQILKDPYCFDFLTLTEDYNEKELENSLIENITHFLLELGQGFSFIGKQFKLEIGDKDFYIDLLFYHVKLHCYVVVELKAKDFKPEYAGKLNFYISAVDDLLAEKGIDKPTIGILICKSKDNMIVEYSLKNIEKPIGISEYTLTKFLPEDMKAVLPSIEEIEAELGGRNE